ncbi:hypothetical protein [Fibrella aestuarina]|nr:hypothetical protein [Fibrella aestuarina]
MNSPRYTFLAAMLLTVGTVVAQTAPNSGTITYETMRRFDPANMRININGQEIRPGGTMPNGATFNPPETMEGEESFQFGGGWAKRNPMARGGNRTFMMRGPGGGDGNGNTPPPTLTPEQMRRMEQMRNFRPPFEETQYTDLATGKTVQIMTITADSLHKESYRSETPVTRPADWQVTSKTKKLLGYTCQKITCTIKEQPCAVWVTTELPYTFSPAPQFTPDKGVVLAIESDDLTYRATRLNAGPVDAATLLPSADAKTVSADELREVRRKAMANFRQQRGMNMPMPNRE